MTKDATMPAERTGPTLGLWGERLVLLAIVVLYIWTFTPDRPNGDGWVYIREIGSGAPNWNPNHLFFQPFGLWFAQLVAALGLGWPMFVVLKVLSGVSAVAAVLLFHATIDAAGVRQPSARIAGSLALFFSGYFLSLALAEEYFMLQMPILIGILLAAVRWIDRRTAAPLIAMGILLAVVNVVQVNNAVLAVLLGLWVAWESRPTHDAVRNLARVWIPGILVGLPALLLPYVLTSSHEGLMTWMTSYQGRGVNKVSALYGLELTPAGIVKSAAALVYGSAQAFAGLGDLGAVVESLMMRRPLEFEPNLPLLVSTAILFLVLAVGGLAFAVWWWRTGRRLPVGRLAAVWTVAYLLFNFLWVDTGDQFWAPILPPLWLCLVLWIRGGAAVTSAAPWWRRTGAMLGTVAVLLAVVNTGTVALYRAFTGVDANEAAVKQLLRPGDLVVTTGWDDVAWLSWAETEPYQRILLMPLALAGHADSPGMKALPEQLQAHLAGGGRVVVARVFDRDREGRPWEQMARLGWPRARVIALLSPLRGRPLGEVGSVRFHELVARPQPARP